MRAVLFLCSILSLAACASTSSGRENRPFVYLAGNTRFTLLPTHGIESPMDMVQYISASFGGSDYFMNAWVKADETALEITLLNEMGAGMGELVYKDNKVTFSSAIIPRVFRPEYIVADFQLCFYDPLLVAQALQAAGLVFESEGGVRRVFRGKNLIIEIEKNENTVRLENRLRGYAYTFAGDFQGVSQ